MLRAMKLYASLTSPFARKIRVFLAEKSLACEFVQADANAPGSPVPDLNPLGKVPVLERDDGSVLFDSPVILEWLDGTSQPRLIPEAGEARWQALLWQALADGLMDAVVTRMLELRRAPEHQSKTAIAHQEGKVARALGWANQRVGGEHLVGPSFGLADVALTCALDYTDFRYPHGWRASLPQLAAWHARQCERPSFLATLPPDLKRPE